MDKETRIRYALRGLQGPEREAEKLRLLLNPKKIQTEIKRHGHKLRSHNDSKKQWDRKRHIQFHIYFTAVEWQLVTRRAKARGGSIAGFLRARALR